MEIRTVGVVGAGQMGGGIAQVAAQADLDVLLYDVAPKMFESCKERHQIPPHTQAM